MTPKQFIEKAIEGGIRIKGSFRPGRMITEVSLSYSKTMIEYYLLDPLAWQAIGKVEGWSEDKDNAGETLDGKKWERITTLGSWIENMHAMIDALVEGKTIEQFLETL